MNTAILGTYGLEFRISKDMLNNKTAIVFGSGNNPLTPYIQNYLMGGNYIEFYEEEIIPEINKAINGQSFDTDGGGEIVFLRIGYPSCFLSMNNGYASELSIPCLDLKEILLSWIEYLNNNNLEY